MSTVVAKSNTAIVGRSWAWAPKANSDRSAVIRTIFFMTTSLQSLLIVIIRIV
jgi:hypothetical protein